MKKVYKIIVGIIVVVLACSLYGCIFATNKEIKRIAIVNNSFKTSYSIDEKLALKNAQIVISYMDGTSSVQAITANMITGFDTAKVSLQNTLTVTYNTFTADFNYSVTSDKNIVTSTRILAEKTNKLSLSLTKSDILDGIYGLSLSIECIEEVTNLKTTLLVNDYKIFTLLITNGIKIIIIPIDKNSLALPIDTPIFEVSYEAKKANFNIYDIILSDSANDITLPNVTI